MAIQRTAHPEESREGFLTLDRNERTADFPPELLRQIRDRVTPFLLRAYPEPSPLYRDLARWLGVPRDHLLLTWGADGGLRSVFDTFVQPGDEVVHAVPSYEMNPFYCAIAAAVERPVRFREDLTLPLEMILEQVTPRTKVVLLAHPNQPIERLYSRPELERLLEICAGCGALLVLDEAYHPFSPETALPMIPDHAHLILVRSFSKAFGIAGLRLGYLVSQPHNIAHLGKVRPMVEANSFAIAVARVLIENDRILRDYVQQVKAGVAVLHEGFARLGLKAYGHQSNSVLVSLPRGPSAADWARALRERGFLVRAETEPPLAHHIRVTAGPPEQMRCLLAEVEQVLPVPATR